MRIIWPVIFSFTLLSLFSLIVFVFLKYLNNTWWKSKIIRRIALLIPILGILSMAVWVVSYNMKIIWLASTGSLLAVAVVVTLLGLIISLPFSGILNKIHAFLEKRAARKAASGPEKVDRQRRAFLKGAAAAVPLVTMTTGGAGIARSFRGTNVYRLPLRFENLPPQLDGLKILHISDPHLGIYKSLSDIEDIIAKADEFKPDIVLLTGDIADDLSLLPDALKISASLNPGYGTYASLGNHEYYRGINEVLKNYDKSSVPLLRSSGVTIDVDGAALYIAGADDPVHMRRDNSAFLKKTIERGLDGAASDAFHLLMSHRPEGFDQAAEFGVDLTLAGHTHGGQVGIYGRSFWEPFMPGRYLWGKYEKGPSQMYLTAGIGHWFPFRLGCPPEAPVIELVSGNNI
ncbi:MAG: metallophosphoesterase [Candidatus Zixiibacteriota bacterium]|nr:MAG: metallophosphoesterase [candidate division Zixibacteria bacterium]